ncbi:MAG: MCE family protein [Nitrospinae bacterium]|nr:MCE family protein [Nitrospinota bacterium]
MNYYDEVFDLEKLSVLRSPRKKSRTEIKVLMLVVIGLLCVGFVSVTLQNSVLGSNYYSVFADFDAVDGLKEGADVEIAGVPVGQVSNISLVPEGLARLEMRIRNDVKLSDDTIASVTMRGILGKKVVKLLPGGSPILLTHKSVLRETESVIDLTGLIGNAIMGKF